jgi:hypothetical protein
MNECLVEEWRRGELARHSHKRHGKEGAGRRRQAQGSRMGRGAWLPGQADCTSQQLSPLPLPPSPSSSPVDNLVSNPCAACTQQS